jgi:hypothetical protein
MARKKAPSLWQIHYQTSYYDSDARGSGTVLVDERHYVLAHNHKEASEKSTDLVAKVRDTYNRGGKRKEAVLITMVTLENLIAVRDATNDGRMGCISVNKYAPVALSLAADQQQYRLEVCLVPVAD